MSEDEKGAACPPLGDVRHVVEGHLFLVSIDQFVDVEEDQHAIAEGGKVTLSAYKKGWR